MILNVALIALFILVYFVLLFFHVRLSWRKFRAFPGAPAFNFSILDIFAATIGLLPTVWLASEGVRDGDLWIHVFVVGVSQIYGIFIGRLNGIIPAQNPPNVLADAMWILGGAIYGLMVLAGGLIVYFVVGHGLVMFIWMVMFIGPIILVLGIPGVLVLVAWWRSH